MAEPILTDRQKKWFASVRASLERDTGKTLDEWVVIARACPETAHRARLRWFKETHGLLQNRASQVISAAFGEDQMGWSTPDALLDALWTDPAARAIYAAVDARAMALEGALRTPRKGYTAWARKVQFAALRPVKAGGVMLGLALEPDADPRLGPPKNESWSERLKARLPLASVAEIDATIEGLLEEAWARS